MIFIRRYGSMEAGSRYVCKAAINMALSDDRTEAVSYTHLDVYKRQA